VVTLVKPDLIRKCLKRLTLNPQIVCFSEVDSTNDEAKRRIQMGTHDELLILADIQTHGRGRYDRTWFSPKGGLYLSLVLKPIINLSSVPLLGFLSACAVVEALRNTDVKRVCLKWPNDVLIAQHKVAGILCELVSFGSDNYMVVIGIGINHNTPIADFPEDIRYSVTSVVEQLGHLTSQEGLLCEILTSIDHWLQITHSDGSFTTVLDEWRRMSATLGTRVSVNDGSRIYIGIAKELLPDGSLLLQTEYGDVTLSIGDVTHLRQD
jgi:BirA family biotin operon repressor/biotin-[acetyl-CoA-carboxylase] ligase